jgi:hypothetical protein
MYQPISFNTIRQALSWSVLPEPTFIRMASTFKWPDGTTSGEYILTFDGAAIREAFDAWELYDGSGADIAAREAIRESFCTDITPVRAWVDAQRDRYCVELYGRVTSHSDEYQLPLLGDGENDLDQVG